MSAMSPSSVSRSVSAAKTTVLRGVTAFDRAAVRQLCDVGKPPPNWRDTHSKAFQLVHATAWPELAHLRGNNRRLNGLLKVCGEVWTEQRCAARCAALDRSFGHGALGVATVSCLQEFVECVKRNPGCIFKNDMKLHRQLLVIGMWASKVSHPVV